MTVKFEKYQGTGNDFIMIDNRIYDIRKNQTALIRRLCDRKFGIGADGLILLQEKTAYHFEMVYFNSDGNESTMCGNGGRCLIKFAHNLGLMESKCSFLAIDGDHEGEILSDGRISLKMKDVDAIENYNGAYILNTGSPHYVSFVDSVETMRVADEGRKIRYSEKFTREGINVNFVEKKGEREIYVRTYERGVEDETLSCGTGVVASALALAHKSKVSDVEKTSDTIYVEVPGGKLEVKFEAVGKGFKNIYLIGPAEEVFVGEVEI